MQQGWLKIQYIAFVKFKWAPWKNGLKLRKTPELPQHYMKILLRKYHFLWMYVFQGITLLKPNLHRSEKSFMVLVCLLPLDNITIFFLSNVYFSALDLSCLKVFSVKLIFLNYGKVLKLILVNLAVLCLLLWDVKRNEELLRRELRALRGAQCSGELPPPAGKGRSNEVWSFCMIWSPSKRSSACLLLLPSWDNRGAKWAPPGRHPHGIARGFPEQSVQQWPDGVAEFLPCTCLLILKLSSVLCPLQR